VKVSLMFTCWCVFIGHSLATGNLWAAFLASIANNMLGFCVMHDASHYGVSKIVWINRILHTLWSDWNLWSHFGWLRHHVYGHHSYTGIWQQDPDLVNSSTYIRKHPNGTFRKVYETQHIHAWFLLAFVPNQHLGQALGYLRGFISNFSVFCVPLGAVPMSDILVWLCIYIPSVYFHFVYPFQCQTFVSAFIMILIYWTGMGIGYMCNVIPNHDTIDTHMSAIKEGEIRDWGVQQVLASGNHTTDGGFWSKYICSMFGGMNYQIEHHLFPAVSHVHYPGIAMIVQKTCAEFGVKYVTHSWLMAMWKYGVLLWLMSFPEVGARENDSKKKE